MNEQQRPPATRKRRMKTNYFEAHKRQLVQVGTYTHTARPDKDHCMQCGEDYDGTNTMIECHVCQLGMHLTCHAPPLRETPKGEWVCEACATQPDTLVEICKSIKAAHLKAARKLKLGRSYHSNMPTDPVMHVKHLCQLHNISWAAHLALYGEQDEAVAVTAGPDTIRDRAKNKDQTRYMVQWRETYMLEHHIESATVNGYKPASIQAVIPEDYNYVPYPLKALGYCSDNALTQQLKKVQWEDTWEPEDNMNITPLKDLLEDYKLKQRQAENNVRNRPTPRHTHLNPAQQQGQWSTRPNQQFSNMDRQVTEHLTLTTQTINPDLDIIPTGKCTIQMGLT